MTNLIEGIMSLKEQAYLVDDFGHNIEYADGYTIYTGEYGREVTATMATEDGLAISFTTGIDLYKYKGQTYRTTDHLIKTLTNMGVLV